MTIILEQIALLFLFMICGFILGKSGLIQHEHTKIISTICVYLFLPCMVFKAFYNSFTVNNLTQYYPLILVSAVLLLLLVCMGRTVSKFLSKDAYEQKIFQYSLIIANYGYMGYALAEGLFGSEGLLHIILFALPFSLYTYTFGVCLLTKKKLSPKQLLNPIILSIFIGAAAGFFSVELPAVLGTFVAKASGSMAPVSMLLAGMTISQFEIRKLLSDKRIFIVSGIRLILIPTVVLLVLKPFFEPFLVRVAVLLCAMPCGMNTIIFPKLIGEDCTIGAKLAFVSNLLSMATIPVILNFI